MKINVIGGGLAGSEAASFLAREGYEVHLYDMKPRLGEAFHSPKFGELVCSNSLKSESKENACGLLKYEMEKLGSLMMEATKVSRIPSGQDLAVDRELFSSYIDDKIRKNKNIIVHSEEVIALEEGDEVINIICTGPLTSSKFCSYLKDKYLGDLMSFFDAAAPLVYFSSLDASKMYYKSRYDKGEGKYLNIPLSKEEYLSFVEDLRNAERVELHDFDHFEGCLPIEVMASRDLDTLRFGPLKAKGLEQEGNRPYAVIQLRQDDVNGSLYNLVGFQTNLTFKEQKRVLQKIKGLENVKFARFGLMHRNSYINAPSLINRDLSLKKNRNIFVAGQFSGVEGYVESAATGLLAGYYVKQRIEGKEFEPIPLNTMLGSLVNYLVMSSPKHFAPMNATYGILQLPFKKDKLTIYEESLEGITKWLESQITK